MKKTILLIIVLVFMVASVAYSETVRLGDEKKKAFKNIEDRLEALDTSKEKNKVKKTELEKRLKDFKGKDKTIEEFLLSLEELQTP